VLAFREKGGGRGEGQPLLVLPALLSSNVSAPLLCLKRMVREGENVGEKEGGRGGGGRGEKKRDFCAHAPQRDSIQAQERKRGGERLRGKTEKSVSGGRGPGSLVAALTHAMYGWVMSHM